jgi:hypothetical protein
MPKDDESTDSKELNENSGTVRYSGRRGLPSPIASKPVDPELVLESELAENEKKLLKLRLFHRPALALLTSTLVVGVFISDFFALADDSLWYALSESSVFVNHTPCPQTTVYDYNEIRCEDDIQKYLPLKWFLVGGGLIIWLVNEAFRISKSQLRASISKTKRQHRLLGLTYQPEFEQVMKRFEFGLAQCPKCGRKARVPSAYTVSVTCGSCSTKWTSSAD